MARIVATLPEGARTEFKEPMGPVFEDVDSLLADAGRPIVAVGDVVTYHLVTAGVTPRLSIVDGLTEREAVDEAVEAGTPPAATERSVENPAGAISEGLIEAVVAALADESATLLRVDGEEDLAVLPVVLLAPDGASVVYGQPGVGMVRVDVDASVRDRVGRLCTHLETEDRFWALVGRQPPN